MIVSLLSDLWPILRFNFHYLPFKQAIRLPVFVHNARLNVLKGNVVIQGPVTTGMIRLGYPWTCHNATKGFTWLCWGGVIFKGHCSIANDSVLEIGHSGTLFLGNNVKANSGLHLSCYKKILIGDNVLISWDVSIFDTDFHRLTSLIDKKLFKTCSKQVSIGNSCWIGFGSTILKGSVLGNKSILAAKSCLTRDFKNSVNTVIGGNPCIILKENVFLDRNNSLPEYGYPWEGIID